MTNVLKFYKGTVNEFKEWLLELKNDSESGDPEAITKYNDIFNSVIYISEHINLDQDTFHCEEGAIYAHGAIIAGSTLSWDDTDSSTYPA